MAHRPTQAEIQEYGKPVRVPKRPLYTFTAPPASTTPIALRYESDFGVVAMRGRSLEIAMLGHRKLKRPGKRRTCYRNCGACAIEAPLNKFLEIVWVAGGVVSLISED